LRTLGIVPARAGSTRLPGKNVRLLGGRPLVAWAIEAARQAERLDALVVSSDDPEVLDIAAAIDPSLPLIRPAELATTESPAIDYVRHALEVLEQPGHASQRRFDAVAIVQPTSPFTQPTTIDAAVALLATTGADSAVSVVRVPHDVHPSKLKTLAGDRLVPYLEDEGERRQHHELAEVYVRSGSVYVSARASIERGGLLGDDSRAVVVGRERSVDINDAVDFAFAEFLLERARST
jgi:CMP-N,N'-diacetyllegionaminic acid synthase